MTEPEQNDNHGIVQPEDAAIAIETSGYLIEARVARVLREHEATVSTNSFYVNPNDPTKRLEVDVEGRIWRHIDTDDGGYLSSCLLIECKNNTQPVAFFVQNDPHPEINDYFIKYDGYPSYSLDQGTSVAVPLHELLVMSDGHHYCTGTEIATQFCSFSHKNKKWKTEPREDYSGSFSNLAVVAEHKWKTSFGLDDKNIQLEMSYPIVVFQGPVYRVQEEQGRARVTETPHVQLRHSATLKGDLAMVQIDVVTEAAFPALIKTITSELDMFHKRVIFQYDRLLKSAVAQKEYASREFLRRAAGQSE